MALESGQGQVVCLIMFFFESRLCIAIPDSRLEGERMMDVSIEMFVKHLHRSSKFDFK